MSLCLETDIHTDIVYWRYYSLINKPRHQIIVKEVGKYCIKIVLNDIVAFVYFLISIFSSK